MESRPVRPAARGAWLTVLLSAAACSVEVAPPASRTPTAADTTLILTELRGYYRALSARDWEAFASHFWPGAGLTTVWQPAGEAARRVVTTSVPEFVAQAPLGPGSRSVFEETLLDARIRTVGDLAQAWVRYQARFGDPGDISEWEGVDAFTLLRHAGRWRIVALAYVATNGGP